jgi:hypothetical protein
MAPQIKRPRGRPPKKVPVFSDPNAEAVRVDSCLTAGLNPYPPFKPVPCHAEKSLRKDASPYIPFNLVLYLNNYDDDGRHLLPPKGKKSLDEAYQKRLEAARNGAAQRPRSNRAAEMIRSERVYIQSKLDVGWSKSKIYMNVKIRRIKADEKYACRAEFYKQLAALGL